MRRIEVMHGDNLESVVYTLLASKARGESVYCEFNGTKLYSDTVSMESAYHDVFGTTKEEIDREKEEYRDRMEREKKEAINNIPKWIERGKAIIFPERHKEWEECVNARANDLYHGLDLVSALEIMEALENGATMDDAKKMFEDQNHSGMSASIVRSILASFSKYGQEFVDATSFGKKK